MRRRSNTLHSLFSISLTTTNRNRAPANFRCQKHFRLPMDGLKSFLHSAKHTLKSLRKLNEVHLVIGNESCDLDSTVSALSLAYLRRAQFNTILVVPILNLPSKYFPIRTEICYVLKRIGLVPSDLIFLEDVNLQDVLSRSDLVKITIVDHHVLPDNLACIKDNVVEIFDHRPVNEKGICCNKHLKKTIKPVGSCCTLIAAEILETKPDILSIELVTLLYSTIVYDTIGLSNEAGRAVKEDFEIAAKLDKILQGKYEKRQLFDELWKVHNDTSTLGTKEILYRDLKIVRKIPMPGLPMLAESYLQRCDSGAAVSEFANEFSAELVVVIGIEVSGGCVKRDLLMFYKNESVKNLTLKVLKQNAKLTRKFITPLVEEIGDLYASRNMS